MNPDHQIDPSTGVPHNLLGATTLEQLRRREADITAAAIYQLQLTPQPGTYDLDHLQAMHARIFGDVYPWAGTLRTQITNRGELFTHPHEIAHTANRLFDHLADLDHLRGLQPTEFADELSACYAWLNSIHPFSEGNGRTQRTFFGQLAREAGYDLRWERLDTRVEAAICREAMYDQSEALPTVFAHLIEPIQPVFGSTAETAHELQRKARQAGLAAVYTAARADRLQARPVLEGRLAATYIHARAEATDKALDIALAKSTRQRYAEAAQQLDKLEQDHAQLLDALNPTTGVKDRGEIRGLETRRDTIAEELRRQRTHLTAMAEQVAEAETAAGPLDTWEYYEDVAIDLQGSWDKYMIYAEVREQQAIVDLDHLTNWLAHHAEQLSQTAANLESGLTTPAQVGQPIGAYVIDSQTTPNPPTEEPPAPQMGL
jgi:cell filamentation protein